MFGVRRVGWRGAHVHGKCITACAQVGVLDYQRRLVMMQDMDALLEEQQSITGPARELMHV